jgi:hypothetical protein
MVVETSCQWPSYVSGGRPSCRRRGVAPIAGASEISPGPSIDEGNGLGQHGERGVVQHAADALAPLGRKNMQSDDLPFAELRIRTSHHRPDWPVAARVDAVSPGYQ